VDTQQDRLVGGRYRLLSRLGSGGMGTVWRARDEVLGREVAVKEVTFPHGLSVADREVLRERTRREARAAARLDHPSAVTVYDVVEEDGAPYLVMELVEARTLSDVVRADGPLSPQRTAQVGLSLLGALETAHAQGILHRDVKPSNVLVRDDGRVVLTDFGIATTAGDSSLTSTGLLLGSPAYIAPERARGEEPGPPSDLWSLGATLFTAVEGKPAFDGGEPMLTVTAVATGEHAPYVAAGALVPVLDGLLEKDPARRLDARRARQLLQTVADRPEPAATAVVTEPVLPAAPTSALRLGAVREEIAAAEPVGSVPAPVSEPVTEPVTEPGASRARPRRRPAWALPVAAGAVALAVIGTVFALNAGDDPGRTAAPSASTPPVATSAPATTAPAGPAPPSAPSATATAAATAAPAGGPLPVPAGWSTDTDSEGWTVALPPGYRRTGGGEYRQSSTGRTLRVETGKGKPDAVQDRKDAARDFARRHPSYQEISIEAVDYRGYEAADWEFTYEGLHVVDRVFVVDGRGYSLYFQTRAADFAGARPDVDGIVAAFRPAGT
jgi:eukaryotic-like serine/threonine-protein kinase